MTETTNTPARPEPVPLSDSAGNYLAELASAAELVLYRRDEAILTERGRWLMVPTNLRRTRGEGAPLNSPLMHVDGYRHHRLMAEVEAARQDVGRVAWWYAAAALAALDAVLTGQEMTARRLEQVTLQRPGRDQEVRENASPWEPCFRPHLPGPEELRTGERHLDEAMHRALTPLREAYAAAAMVEQTDEDLAGEEPSAEWELAGLERAHEQAVKIPHLLIAYARVVHIAAHNAHRARRS